MKKLSALGVVALAALVAVLAMMGLSSPAQAYPDVQIGLTASGSVVYGGHTFTVTASSNVDCAWNVEWNNAVREGHSTSGSDFTTRFTAPRVTRITKIPVHGTCVYDGGVQTTGRSTSDSQSRTITITVLPPSTAVSPPVGSDLPNTGGPNLLFILGGLALLVSGVTAVSVARRRAEEAEIPASRA